MCTTVMLKHVAAVDLRSTSAPRLLDESTLYCVLHAIERALMSMPGDIPVWRLRQTGVIDTRAEVYS